MTLEERKRSRSEYDLRRLAAGQFGVFSFAQAIDAGLSPAGITRRLDAGSLERLLPRVYRVAGVPSTGPQEAMAAALWAGSGAVVSHGTAGLLWSIPGVRGPKVELWVPAPRSPRSNVVRVHRGDRVDRADRTRLGPIPITTPVRTLIDVSGRLEDDRLLAAMEAVFRLGLGTPQRLAARLDALRASGRPGTGRLYRLLVERDVQPSESALEARVWLLLRRSELPRPIRQHEVSTPGGRYRLDFAWPERKLALECDGWEHHGTRVAFGKDRARLSEMTSGGWRVLVVTWDVATREPSRVLRWVVTALADAAA